MHFDAVHRLPHRSTAGAMRIPCSLYILVQVLNMNTVYRALVSESTRSLKRDSLTRLPADSFIVYTEFKVFRIRVIFDFKIVFIKNFLYKIFADF
jgi:hypothetical protein